MFATLGGTTAPAVAAARPDLQIASISKPPDSVAPGESFKLVATVRNDGSKRAGSSHLGYYLSDDRTRDFEDLRVLVRSMGAIAPKRSVRVKAMISVGDHIPPAAYYVIACADDKRRVRESKEKNNCRAADSPFGVADVPNSRELIAADLEAGVIDLGTSLLYRAYAFFADPRLPTKYVSDAPIEEDGDLFLEARVIWENLSPEAQAALEPFLARPNDPKSIFGPDPGARRVGQTAASSKRCATEWLSKEVLHFVIWVCKTSAPQEDAAVLDRLGTIADAYWDEMTKDPPAGMGPPQSDSENEPTAINPNGKIDLYIVDGTECPDRDYCSPLEDGDYGAMIPDPRSDDFVVDSQSGMVGIKSSSGYILMRRERIRGTDAFKSDFVHEFFHVLQYAHQGSPRDLSYIDGRLKFGDLHWFVEASAKWAEWRYVPELAASAVHPLFTWKFQRSRWPLWFTVGDYEYATYIWPYFVQQEDGDKHIFETWVRFENATGIREMDEALDAQFSFAEHFRDFAVRNLNAELPGDPIGTMYSEQHDVFPKNVYPKIANQGVIGAADAPTSVIELLPLQAQYDWFGVKSSVGKVTLDFAPLPGGQNLDFDIIAELNDGDWKRFRVEGNEISFCRNHADQHVTELFVILSNHDMNRHSPPIEGRYEIEAIETPEDCGAVTSTAGGTYQIEGPSGGEGRAGDTRRWEASFQMGLAATGTRFASYQLTSGTLTWSGEGFNEGCSYTVPPQTFTMEAFYDGFDPWIELTLQDVDGDGEFDHYWHQFSMGGQHSFDGSYEATWHCPDRSFKDFVGGAEVGANDTELRPYSGATAISGSLEEQEYEPESDTTENRTFEWNLVISPPK